MRAVGLCLVLFAAACGSSNGGGPAPDAAYRDAPGSNAAMRYNPWKMGASWAYQITPTGGTPVSGRITSVVAYEDVGGDHAGTFAFKLHVQLNTGSKDVWEAAVGEIDARYKTSYYNASNALTETDSETPYRLKLDESAAHTMNGASWSETFSETATIPGSTPTTKSETLNWSVVNNAEAITVMAGSYTALHVRRVNPAKAETIDYWYALGVGKLKETGGNTTEELMSYTPGS